MSKITNDSFIRSGTGYSCAHMATVGVKGLTFEPNLRHSTYVKIQYRFSADLTMEVYTSLLTTAFRNSKVLNSRSSVP